MKIRITAITICLGLTLASCSQGTFVSVGVGGYAQEQQSTPSEETAAELTAYMAQEENK